MPTSEEVRRLTEAVERLAAQRESEAKGSMLDVLRETRAPSMASRIGPGRSPEPSPSFPAMQAHPFLKSSLGDDYVPGSFITAIANARSRDAAEQAVGKAALESLGVRYADESPYSSTYTTVGPTGKATTGTTGSTGGYVLPNNLVDSLIKPETQRFRLSTLFTEVNGVSVRGVDMPFRLGAPAKMTFQDWNTLKENVDETYGSYTATLGTLARVMDVTKQYLRFSAGAAERDVIDELTRAAILAENYYILAGVGTGTVGSGDPTYGLYTGLNARPGFKTAFSAAATNTVAGSFAAACATGMQQLASRSRTTTAILTDQVTLMTALREGSDTAGFWVDPSNGPTAFAPVNAGGGVFTVRYFGVPVYGLPTADTDTGASKFLIAIDGSAFKFYRGMEFRIDSSDVANTRWDYNLIGYRGEEEIGFHAGPGIEVGGAQLVTAVIA